MTQSRPDWRLLLVLILCIVYVVVVVPLALASRREAALAAQVGAGERDLAQRLTGRNAQIQSLRSSLAARRAQQAALGARFSPAAITPILEEAALRAAQSGVTDFRYGHQSDYVETLRAGQYGVYGVSIQGRGSRSALLSFVDSLQTDPRWMVLVDDLTLSAAGRDWQMNATILVYTIAS